MVQVFVGVPAPPLRAFVKRDEENSDSCTNSK